MTRAALTRATSIVAFLTIGSRIFGFVREASIASVFGATREIDAFLIAQVIPLLFVGVVRHALTTTFIPIYSQARADAGKPEAFRLANTVLRAVLGMGVILVVLGEIAAGSLIGLIAPGFHGANAELAVYLSRIILPITLVQLISGIVTGILQAEGQFTMPSMEGLLRNTSMIIATLAFGSRYGVIAIAVGLLVGVTASLLVKLPTLIRIGFRWNTPLDIRDPGLQRIGVLIVPAVLGSGATQLNLLVDRMLASGLPGGRIAALNYAVRLNDLVPSIVGASIITVLYPMLAGMAAEGRWQAFGRDLLVSLRIIHFMLVPVSVGAIVLRDPLVRLVYERGAFDASATHQTAWALLFLAAGIAFTSMYNLISRAFYALQDTSTPMYIGFATVAINIMASLVFLGSLEQGGLALGTSVASLFGLILSLVILGRRVPGGLSFGPLIASSVRVITAAVLMGFALSLLNSYVTLWVQAAHKVSDATLLLCMVLLGASIYLLLTWILRVPELQMTLQIGKRFVRGTTGPPSLR